MMHIWTLSPDVLSLKAEHTFSERKYKCQSRESDGEMRVLWSELLRPKAGVPAHLCSHYLAG